MTTMTPATIDVLLCDELLQEIFHRLPPSSSSAVVLVSKRWLRLLRSSTTSLSLRFSPALYLASTASFTRFLSAHPYVTSLSIVSPPDVFSDSDRLLLAVASCCPGLIRLRLSTAPVAASSISSLSTACSTIVCLNITVSRTFLFTSLASFPCLKDLAVSISGESVDQIIDDDDVCGARTAELLLESLSLTGIRSCDRNLGWLWRSSKRLRELKLKCCEGVGDGGSFSSLDCCLPGLKHVEFRTCRTIVDVLLCKLAESCHSLSSLLIYDGASRQGLLHFISICNSDLRILDFRLPLDLNDDHLVAIAQQFTGLETLRLQSCCLVTGRGLEAVGAAIGLQELALVSCDAVERETGLLSCLGQKLKKLRILDLSYNETLQDKELVSMLGSCGELDDLKLRGCRGITNAALHAISKGCKQLKAVDIAHCWKLDTMNIELFVLNLSSLRRIVVEEGKVTDVVDSWMRRKSIHHVFA